jgi:4-hydroxybenzoyl-CoA reductase subunit alpha
VDGKLLLDGGAYASFGLVTAYYSGQLLTAPYTFDTYRFDSTRVYTNKPACGPKRGHGSVQPRFAFEVQLDKLAERLGIDPIEIRRRNFIGERTRTINELRVTSNGFLQCLDAVERASDWKRSSAACRTAAASASPARATSPARTTRSTRTRCRRRRADPDRAQRPRRRVHRRVEIGQGSNSMVAYIAAEELGVPLEYVRVHATDTDMTPVDLGAYSSRETFMVGNACIMAARRPAQAHRARRRRAWDVARRAGRPGRRLGVRPERHRSPHAHQRGVQHRRGEARHARAVGHYNTPKDVHGDYRGGTIGASPAYSFTAHVAEVEVDVETGVVAWRRSGSRTTAAAR